MSKLPIVDELRDGSDGWTGDAACVSADVAERGAEVIETLVSALTKARHALAVELETRGRGFDKDYPAPIMPIMPEIEAALSTAGQSREK